MIIDAQYFKSKELYIPNSVAQPNIGSASPSALLQLNEEIDSIEHQLLLDMLGYAQTTELKDQFELIDGEFVWKIGALQKWIDLVDGKDEWRGLRYTIGGKKVSVIAYYVFFQYLGLDYNQYTTNGMQISKVENSITQDPSIKQVSVWNRFIKMYIGDNWNNNVTISTNWNGAYLSYLKNDSNELSVYDFLSNNRDVYDISYFVTKRPLNYFGI